MLVAAGCTAGGPVSYEEADELREQVADMEERLSEVESMLSDVHEALETPELDTQVPPPQPAPGGAGGTSM